MRRFLLLSLLPLAACGKIEEIQDVIDGLTNPLVAEALLLGVIPPESDLLDLEGTPFEDGTALKVFLADASSIDDLEQSPLDGAVVTVKSAGNGTLELDAGGGGVYSLNGAQGLEYEAGQDFILTASLSDVDHRVTVTAPHAPDLDLDEQHPVGEPLLIDLSEYEFDNVLVAVFDAQSGEVSYTNRPETIVELYDYTHGEGTVDRHEIPGSAFPRASVYAVGVAGMRNAVEDDYDSMNTALSSCLMGQMRFWALTAP
ncbi:MAG: hypothetical protein ABIO70_13235 [Pseudomonadota bacterium]